MRKLLPYEHQLIESLGITKEQYLEFVAIQQEYKDPKAGTALDVRNEVGTVAIVLTVVGILFQVGAALLAPKPEIPDISDRRRRNREQRFSPTFGFNSTQELASYGDPVNLVYTNQNANGNVRVAGSLVWSAIENFGSTQFMQLILALGASKIQSIDYSKTAFGQAALADLDKQSVFIFAKSDGTEGRPNFGDIQGGFGTKSLYPERLKPRDAKPAFQIVTHNDKRFGFSQAYTPSTSTSLGVFDAIPINVDVISRDKDGKEEESNIGIELRSVSGTANYRWRDRRGAFKVNEKIRLFFNNAGYVQEDKDPARAADDLRRQMVEALDFGSTYMLGSAKFRLEQVVSTAKNIDAGEVNVDFVCIEPGQVPGSPYDRTEPKTEDKNLKREMENAQAILSDARTIEGIEGVASVESVEGAEGAEGARTEDFVVTSSSPFIDIRFQGNKTVEWTPTFNAEIELEDGTTQIVPYVVDVKGSYVFPLGGSIAYTREQKDELMADKPKIKTKKIRKDIRRRKKALKALIEDIYAGVFNGENLPQGNNSYGPPWSAHYGRDPNEQEVEPYVLQTRKSFLEDDPNIGRRDTTGRKFKDSSGDGPIYHGYGKQIIQNDISKTVSYTFIYIDRYGIWHFFPFNGIEDQGKQKFFPNDPNLRDKKRPNLKNAKEKLSTLQAERDALTKQTTKIKSDSVTDPNSVRTVLNKDTELEIEAYNSKITEQEELVEERREAIKERIDRNFAKMHKLAADVIQDDIDYLEAIQDAIPVGEEIITDQVGTSDVKSEMRSVIKLKEKALENINQILEDWDEYRQSLDNNFFSRCLVKTESASYETLSLCDSVKFSFKARLFRRITGRQKKYADRKVKEYSASDNGVKSRMAFFRVFYKSVHTTTGGLTINNVSGWSLVPYVFAIRRGSDADFYTQLGFFNSTKDKWQFRFEPVFDMQAEYFQRPFTKYAFIENTDQIKTVTEGSSVFFWYGKTVGVDTFAGYYPDENERGPIRTNEWDMFSVNSDTQIQFSFESGPEIALTAVTEQQSDSSYGNKYNGMTMMGVGVFAGRGIQDLRSISTLVTNGKLCRTVENPNAATASSSYAPDIFVDTIKDAENGIAKYVDTIDIDTTSLQQAKNFCIGNNLPRQEEGGAINLFMDGIIADVGSWREFWVNNAPFSLLELARKNGKDTLVPALPCNSAGLAADNNGVPVEVPISALFTTGNILEDSYKEEFLNYGTATEDIIASVIYREYNDKEIFSTKQSVDVHRNDPEFSASSAIRETFDLSQFVTQREQAIMFGKLLCNQRRYIRKGIEFRTFPSEAVIEPGDFVFVDIGLQDWDRYSAGVVMENGELNTPLSDAPINGTYEFLFYNPATGDVKKRSSVTVTNNDTAFNAFAGYMFVMGIEKPQKRVYRVTEIAIEEEGEVAIKAIDYPCFVESGRLCARIADFRASNFAVS
jgi:hypothetical protein